MYMCVSLNLVIIASGNGLVPDWCQAITWPNANYYIIDFNENMIKVQGLNEKCI